MLRVTIEIVPYGQEADKRVLDVLVIGNDGTGTEHVGNYRYEFGSDHKKGEIKAFPRAKGFWSLICRILKQENKEIGLH